MSVSRWLRHLSLVTLVALVGVIALGSPAHAQVFKPRGGKPAVAGKATTGAAVARKATPAATSSKRPARAAPTPRRAAPPAKKARGKARAEPDAVVIEDEDEDVKITDD